MPNPTEIVAANIRAEMARQRKSQTDLAAALGTTQQAISARFNAKTPFSIEQVTRAADFLGVPASVLFGDTILNVVAS